MPDMVTLGLPEVHKALSGRLFYQPTDFTAVRVGSYASPSVVWTLEAHSSVVVSCKRRSFYGLKLAIQNLIGVGIRTCGPPLACLLGEYFTNELHIPCCIARIRPYYGLCLTGNPRTSLDISKIRSDQIVAGNKSPLYPNVLFTRVT